MNNSRGQNNRGYNSGSNRWNNNRGYNSRSYGGTRGYGGNNERDRGQNARDFNSAPNRRDYTSSSGYGGGDEHYGNANNRNDYTSGQYGVDDHNNRGYNNNQHANYNTNTRNDSGNNHRNQLFNQDRVNEGQSRGSGLNDPVLYFGSETNEISDLVKECLNHALLDSGAGKTVCGDNWLSVYEDALQRPVTEIDGDNIHLRFGDSEPVKSSKRVKIPAEVGNKCVFFDTYVVPCNIPLLISRESMKRAKMSIDFANDHVKIGEVEHPTAICSSGQYLIPILPSKDTGNLKSMLYPLYTVSESSTMSVKKKAEKLHKILTHASTDRIYKLAVNADAADPNLKEALNEVVQECEVCNRIKKPPPRPKVCMPLSNKFNEVVAMDIKYIEGSQFST